MNKKEFTRSLNVFQVILWGYSLLQIVLIVLLGFLPSSPTGADDPIAGLLSFSPMMIFLLLIIIRHKLFSWNIWKVLLTVYSALFSLLLCLTIIFSMLIVSLESGTSATMHSNMSLGLLFIIPVFIQFVLFGDEVLKMV